MINEKTPTETWDQLKKDKNAVLIDVRTPEEWEHIGYPDLSSLHKKVIQISVQNIAGEQNNNFIANLKDVGINSGETLYFICRSGKRSMLAATLAKQAGFHHIFNVKNGFEGPEDNTGKTGKIAGWVAEKLPFIQPV